MFSQTAAVTGATGWSPLSEGEALSASLAAGGRLHVALGLPGAHELQQGVQP